MIVRHNLVIAPLLAISLCASAAETIYYVSKAGDGSDGLSWATAFTHPQDAVDAAEAAANPDGARVVIADDTYTVKNASDASVVTISAGGITLEPQNAGGFGVILNGGTAIPDASPYIRRVLTIGASLSDVTVSGLVLTNGAMTYNKGLLASCVLAKSGTITGCRIYGYCRRRCAFCELTGNTLVSNCLISGADKEDFYASMSGTDVGVRLKDSAQIVDSTIENFRSHRQANGIMSGIHLMNSGTALRRCVVRGIREIGSPAFDGSETTGWGASTGGAIYAAAGTIEDCVVTNNHVFGRGGGIYVAGSVTIRDCVFWDNKATAAGNDIFIPSGKNPTITGTTATDLADDENGNTNLDPTAPFSVSGNENVGIVPFAVTFRAADGDASATWDFGDGATGTGATPAHTYETPGVYTVSRTVGGATVARTGYITATGPTLYVSKTGSATPPYDTVAKAARHPQDAIDLARAGTAVVIGDGTYAVRDAKDYSVMEINRSGIAIRSANGRGSVFIDGGTGEPANGRVRRSLIIGAGLSDVSLSGLVLTNGFMTYVTQCYPSAILALSGTIFDTDIDVYCNRRSQCVDFGGTLVYTNGNFSRRRTSTNAPNNNDAALNIRGAAKVIGVKFHHIANVQYKDLVTAPIRIVSADAVIRNCLFHGITSGLTTASTMKGGALYASAGTVENCTFYGNKSYGYGGAVYLSSPSVVFRNNIVWGNTATVADGGNDIYAAGDYSGCSHSCASDLAAGVNGNVSSAPTFADAANGDLSLEDTSPVCIDAGSDQPWMVGATDLTGNPRLFGSAVDMGAYEVQTASSTLSADFSVSSASSFGPAPFSASFLASVGGDATGVSYAWDFGDGSSLPASAANAAPSHTYTAVGAYNVTLTVSKSGFADLDVCKTNCIVVVGDVCHVAPGSAGTPPYDTWAKATSNLQAAVALRPATVLATNGTYTLDYSTSFLGVEIASATRVVSVEGPDVTFIDSGIARQPSETSAMRRLATLSADGAVLDGFTLVRALPPAVYATAGTLRNCVVSNYWTTYTSPFNYFIGTSVASNCVFDAKRGTWEYVNANATAAYVGGDAALVSCEVRNVTWSHGNANDTGHGAIYALGNATLRNCFVHDVSYSMRATITNGPGIRLGGNAIAENCTVRRCWSRHNPPGGIMVVSSGATVRNCVSYGNTGGTGEGVVSIDAHFRARPAACENSLFGVATLPANAENCIVGEDPVFALSGRGCELGARSPCHDSGVRLDWMCGATDIDGKRRTYGRPDIGCWELPYGKHTVLELK